MELLCLLSTLIIRPTRGPRCPEATRISSVSPAAEALSRDTSEARRVEEDISVPSESWTNRTLCWR